MKKLPFATAKGFLIVSHKETHLLPARANITRRAHISCPKGANLV